MKRHQRILLALVGLMWLSGCDAKSSKQTAAPPAERPRAVGGEPAVVPEPAAEPVEAGVAEPVPAAPGEADNLEDGAFIGLSVAEGTALAEHHHIPARVVKVDGEEMMVTQDYRPERVNFTVENGVIIKVTRG